jgi:transposase InsO family protein
MRELGLRGAVRGKIKRTTVAEAGRDCVKDLVKQDFNADAPNSLWVADFTCVSAWTGWCCVALAVDAFARRIVGCRVSTRMNRDMVAAAFRPAVFARSKDGRDDFSKLIRHNDKGSQYTANDFVELPALCGVRASMGSVGGFVRQRAFGAPPLTAFASPAVLPAEAELRGKKAMRSPKASTARTKRSSLKGTALGKTMGKSILRRQAGCIGTTLNESANATITCPLRKLKIYGIPRV